MPFNPDLKILPKNQLRVLPALANAKEIGFCLYGGTAIALRFGHRQSIDFDFFSGAPLDKALLLKTLPILNGAQVIQEGPNTYVVLASPPRGAKNSPVKISFFGDLTFGRVGTPELTDDGVLLVASIRDLMATKLKVLFDRVEVKDYLDIAEMLKRDASLFQGLRDAIALYPSFSPIICLKSLCYFDLPELAGLDKNCRAQLVKAVNEVSRANQDVTASAIAAPHLGLSAEDLAAEIKLAREIGATDPSRRGYDI